MPQGAASDNNNNGNANQGGAGDATEVQDDAQPSTSTTNVLNAENYDAAKARKSKKRTETEVWQDKILKCLEPVDVPQAQPIKKEYVDSAFETIALQMKQNLSNNEILDLVEDIQGMVNRACREKQRRIDMANQVSNNMQMYQGPGPQGPTTVPVSFDEQNQQQQPFYNPFYTEKQ